MAGNSVDPTMRTGLTSGDWSARMRATTDRTQRLNEAGLRSRHSAQHYNSVALEHVKWTARLSDTELQRRIDDVAKARDVLFQYLEAVADEVTAATTTLDTVQHNQDDLRPLLNLVSDCTVLRDERSESEVVEDDVQNELVQAKEMLRDHLVRLQRLADEGQQTLETLKEIEWKIVTATRRQEASLEVDRAQLTLTECSARIGFKPDQSKPSQNTISEEYWKDRILELIRAAENTVGRSRSFREQARFEIIRVRQEVTSQHEGLQYAFRKAVHRHKMAVDQLTWQEVRLAAELDKIDVSNERTEERLDSINFPIKLTQSRLENRNDRAEPCYDVAQQRLTSQAEDLENMRSALDLHLQRSRVTQNQIEAHLTNVRHDIRRKKHALDLDRKCLQTLIRFAATTKQPEVTFIHQYPDTFAVPHLHA